MAVTGYEPPSNGARSRHDPSRPRSPVEGRSALLRLKRASMNHAETKDAMRLEPPSHCTEVRAWGLEACVDEGVHFHLGVSVS